MAFFCGMVCAVDAKAKLREAIGARIAELSAEDRIVMDAQIMTQITHLSVWHDADTLFGYMAMDDEVDLQALFRAALREGKVVALPRIAPGTRTMVFCRVDEMPVSLERHVTGFLQPGADAPVIEPGDGTLIVCPGRAFDRRGARLGRGGGYYDRFLARTPRSVTTVGVGYAAQMVREVPDEDSDVAVHIVITETETCFSHRSGAP